MDAEIYLVIKNGCMDGYYNAIIAVFKTANDAQDFIDVQDKPNIYWMKPAKFGEYLGQYYF